MTLFQLHSGIDIAEYRTRIPWLITEPELEKYIPASAIKWSPHGWPLIDFCLIGTKGEFGLNFVTHPERKLMEIQFTNEDGKTVKSTYRKISKSLRSLLGEPTNEQVPKNDWLVWQDEVVRVENVIFERTSADGKQWRPLHMFSVRRLWRVTTED